MALIEAGALSRKHSKGENEITRDLKRQLKPDDDPCAILADWLHEAKQQGDTDRVEKIKEAQKFMGCRNVRKRESE